MTQHYLYAWRNNSTRATYYGCRCRVTARGRMNTIRLEFDDGRILLTSGNAIRKVFPEQAA
jgi:hypothetical protein